MTNRIFFSALVFIALLSACSGNHSKSGDTDQIALNASDSCVIGGEPETIWQLDIHGNHAAVYNSNDSGFISVYSYPGFRHLYSYGRRGNGPDEWISKMYGRNGIGDGLIAYDIMKATLYQLEVTDSAIIRTEIASLPQRDGHTVPYGRIDRIAFDLFLAKENDMDGSHLIISDLSGDAPLAEYAAQVKSNGRIKGYPFDDFFFAASPDRVLVAYENADLVDLLDLKSDNLELVKRIGTPVEIDAAAAGKSDRKRYAMQVVENGSRFFILIPTEGTLTSHLIRVIDSNGNDACSYLLDREINRIAFDAQGRLIATAEKEEANVAYTFILPSGHPGE